MGEDKLIKNPADFKEYREGIKRKGDNIGMAY